MVRTLAVAFLTTILALAVGTAPAAAHNIGMQGCTPGYWKNHTDNWQETTPDTAFSSLFTAARNTSLANVTAEEALRLHGGRGVAGAERILARAAMASWLNSAHEGLGFPWRRFGPGLDGREPLVQQGGDIDRGVVNAAFLSGDRGQLLALAGTLDRDNNLGCPLS